MAMIPIYSFGHGVKPSTSWISTTDKDPGYFVINCPVCDTRGLLEYPAVKNHPAGLCVTRPGTVDDILFLGPGVWAASARVQTVIKRHRFTGVRWKSPTEIVCEGHGPAWRQTVARIEAMGMKIACVTGDVGSVSTANNVRITKQCAYCGWMEWSRRPQYLRIDERKWDGSDFFVTAEYRSRFFTQRAADALATEGLSNFTAELEGFIVDPRKPFVSPSRKKRIDVNNVYLVTAVYGDPAERREGVYKPFWAEFFAGKLGERTLANALLQATKFRPAGKRWIKDWKWVRK